MNSSPSKVKVNWLLPNGRDPFAFDEVDPPQTPVADASNVQAEEDIPQAPDAVDN